MRFVLSILDACSMCKTILTACLLLLASPAFASDTDSGEWASPTLTNLVHTLFRYGALDLNDDRIIDDYAKITECELVIKFYHNDFKWNKVRAAVRQSMHMNMKTYPSAFYYVTRVQLGRYDFKGHMFLFDEGTKLQGVNSFQLTDQRVPCGRENLTVIPTDYHLIIDVPVTLLGLPLSEKDAEALLDRMDLNDDKDRVIYAQFNLRVVHIAPMHKVMGSDQKIYYTQQLMANNLSMRINAQLDTIEFFEDKDRTHLIYTYNAP